MPSLHQLYEAQRLHATHYEAVLRAARDLYLQGGAGVTRGLAVFDAEWAHIASGQAWAAARVETDDDAARLCNAYPNAGAYVLNLRLPAREQIRWLEGALGVARRLRHREAESAHLTQLGNAYGQLNKAHRAIELYEQALMIDREVGDKLAEGHTLGNLGMAYTELGEARRAIEYQEQALVIVRELGDKRDEGYVLSNLGSAYYQLDKVHRAIEYYEKALVIDRKVGNKHAEGQSLSNLGSAYFQLDKVHRAIEYYEQHLNITREIRDRHGEGNVLMNLGFAYFTLGKKSQAITTLEAALKILEDVEDPSAWLVKNQLMGMRSGCLFAIMFLLRHTIGSILRWTRISSPMWQAFKRRMIRG